MFYLYLYWWLYAANALHFIAAVREVMHYTVLYSINRCTRPSILVMHFTSRVHFFCEFLQRSLHVLGLRELWCEVRWETQLLWGFSAAPSQTVMTLLLPLKQACVLIARLMFLQDTREEGFYNSVCAIILLYFSSQLLCSFSLWFEIWFLSFIRVCTFRDQLYSTVSTCSYSAVWGVMSSQVTACENPALPAFI